MRILSDTLEFASTIASMQRSLRKSEKLCIPRAKSGLPPWLADLTVL